MTAEEVLELWNMFIMGAQIEKKKNKHEYHFEMDEKTLSELLKKAFPSIKDENKITNWAKEILENR